MRVFCMFGVRGCGKSALISSILPQLPKFSHVSSDSILKGLVGPRYDDFDQFPDEIKKQFRSRSIIYMKEEAERSRVNMIVESYASKYNPNTHKIERIFPQEGAWFFTDLILYSVDPRMVLMRRRKDPSTPRQLLDPEFIAAEVRRENEEAISIAEQMRLDFYVIKEDGMTDVRSKLLRILMGNR